MPKNSKNVKSIVNRPCSNCRSPKVFHFRLDSDWGYGAGDYTPVNPDSFYTKEELAYDSMDRPSIELLHCLTCGHKEII